METKNIMNNINIFVKDFKEKTKMVDGEFGHNCEFNFLAKFKKFINQGIEIKIINYYTVSIDLSSKNFDTLLFIITNLPGTSNVVWKNKTNELILEWHF